MMDTLLEQKAVYTDRAVLSLIVAFNAAALCKIPLSPDTRIGGFNGTLAGVLLATSIWRSKDYPRWRRFPIIVMRLAVCVLPLIADTVGPFARNLPGTLGWPWQLGRALFMLLVAVSWALGLFLSTFLLLPPLEHLAVSGVSLAVLLSHNRTVCQLFLDQHPSNASMIDALDAALRALLLSTSPAAQHDMALLGQGGRLASCMAGSAAIQVSLGLVLPTLLAWQLQCRMTASIAAHAEAAEDLAMAAEVRRSQHAVLCCGLASVTQGWTTKLLLTGVSMLLSYVIALLLVT